MEVFATIEVDFMLVGHTGNQVRNRNTGLCSCTTALPNSWIFQVDQLFSILCRVLRSEIRCPDDLIRVITEAPVIPKPEVEELLYIWDWRGYITPKLTEKSLKNHSFYHSFQLKREDGRAVFRAKKYSQLTEWGPEVGIKLLKDGFEATPVPASEFRIETLNLDKVFSDLYTKFFPTLDTQDRQEAEASWERLRTKLENLPKKRENLLPMKLSSLPQIGPSAQPLVPNYLESVLSEDLPDLIGEHCVLDPVEGHFDVDIVPGMDVAVYSQSVKDRPWLGRVLKIEESKASFEIHWFKRKGRSFTFQGMFQSDGSPFKSMILLETVMMWEFSTKKQIDSFDISKDIYDKIMSEYVSHDACYK